MVSEMEMRVIGDKLWDSGKAESDDEASEQHSLL